MTQRVKKTIDIEGMTCVQCEKIIAMRLTALPGVEQAVASFKSGCVLILYDEDQVSFEKIAATIRAAGYELRRPKSVSPPSLELIATVLILISLYVMIDRHGGFDFLPEISQDMGYGVLFVVGILTSLHCVAMCGGIGISQCLPQNTVQLESRVSSKWDLLKPSFYYNMGRVVSYTIIGGIVGALGSVLTLSGSGKGFIAILAGVFMIIMGLNMLGAVPALKKFNVQMPQGLRETVLGKKGDKGPFVVGLLNGLMPCGPLQAMQIYALGTGSMVGGALSMFFFSLGTVPLMFGLGAVSTQLGKNFTKKMTQMGAILVVFLGFIMAERGFVLSGFSAMNVLPSGGQISESLSDSGLKATVEGSVQKVTGDLSPGGYPNLVVQKGVPVEFRLNAGEGSITGCNASLQMPSFNVEQDLQLGENLIKFTPTESGTYSYSCWMGMIQAQVTVVDSLEAEK